MMYRKPICCSNCGDEIRSGSNYAVIYGDIFCRSCAKDWMMDELAERFDGLFDELAEILGVSVCENSESA